MGNRSRHKARHLRTASSDLPLARLMRSHCPQCASPVGWLTADQAQIRGIDLGPALRFLGLSKPAEIWVCRHCGNFGVLGPTEHSTL